MLIILIILNCAWECFDNSNGNVPGLAGGQGAAAVFCAVLPDRLKLQCELELEEL